MNKTIKNILIFLAGAFTCFVVMTIIGVYITNSQSQSNDVTMFENPQDYTEGSKFKVFQVLEPTAALVHVLDKYNISGAICLLINDDNKYYYDDEKINITTDKCVKQVGIYQYSTQLGYKTVPIIQIFDK